jgi:LysM repeat protein
MSYKHFLWISSLLLCIGSTISGQTITRTEYVERFKDIAIAEMKRTGIPASITLAQGILESNSGNGRLATEANNHFGIKCHEWTGPSIRHDDDAPGECFRVYKQAEDSYRDHSEFLMTRSRYAFLFKFPYNDYINWAHGLKKAGYATNPQYAQLLIKIIDETSLAQFDNMNYKSSVEKQLAGNSSMGHKKTDILKSRLAVNGYTLYEVNGVKVIVARDGDSFNGIAIGLGMNPDRLASLNDLATDYSLYSGQWVYLEKKKSKAARGNNYHTVKEGESLYNIAQEYGMRLESLYKLNGLPYNAPEPEPGMILNLRKKKR